MRRRGDRVKITSERYAGRSGTVESNVFQMSVDYPDEQAEGFHVILDTEELVTVRWDQGEAARSLRAVWRSGLANAGTRGRHFGTAASTLQPRVS